MTCDILSAEFYAIANGFEIKKQYWRKYQIIQIKWNQYQYYRIGGIGKYEINKNRTDKYKYLITFRKICWCCNISIYENMT